MSKYNLKNNIFVMLIFIPTLIIYYLTINIYVYFFFYYKIFFSLIIIFTILIGAAYLTLVERQLVAIIQQRSGPKYTGSFFALIQPLINGLKLFLRYNLFIKNITNNKKQFIMNLIPFLLIIINLNFFFFLNFKSNYFLKNEFLYIIIFLIIATYPLFILNFRLNNKFNILGNIRVIILIISYDICLTMILLPFLMLKSSLELNNIHQYITLPNFNLHINATNIILILSFSLIHIFLFFIIILGEGMKIPFDIVKSEGELASSYMNEYSSINFAFIVISEYIGLIFMFFLFTKFFWGNNYIIIIIICTIFFLILRTILPNYRFNTIMTLFWKYIFIFSIFIYMLYILIYFI